MDAIEKNLLDFIGLGWDISNIKNSRLSRIPDVSLPNLGAASVDMPVEKTAFNRAVAFEVRRDS